MKTELRPVRRALVSVSDKSGLDELARALVSFNVEIISTGGTATSLRNLGIAVTDVADVTGFPEIMDGRVKTLHPKIHGGLLAVRGNSEHEIARISHGIDLIDLLIVNLYPFETALDRQTNEADCIENIDVGGPAMIRAAAKNHASVAVIVDPMDYGKLIAALGDNNGHTTLAMRKSLAGKAFARTASYDAAIANWFARSAQSPHPDFFATGGARARTLRYGENPHQTSALYRVHDGRVGLLDARQMQGKELSYNNINDADTALEAVAEFSTTEAPCCVIVKHANPCGVATGKSLVEAYRKALACDPISAFGGIIACNRLIDRAAAEEISKTFTEVILAPGVDDAAAAIISAKKNLRLLVLPRLPDPKLSSVVVKSVAGGLLVQSRDNTALEEMELQIVTKRHPSPGEMADLRFAWIVAKHVKSNAIVLAKDGATVGIGAGQMSRIDSTRIAAHKSAEAARAQGLDTLLAKGAVLASDAFFPFADGIVAAADAGATAIIQPGGSIRDDEVIAAADERGLAMVFTGQRHFRH